MTQAIYYSNKDDEATAIPEQAIAIVIDHELNKATLLTALDKALSFPDYFAHNWDSAWDCLTDSDAEHLRLDLTDVKQINTEDFNVFKSMIEDAYRDFGQPQLWVVV
ncbi:barstar family protein [Psychrobacter sp. M13]|uniref:barstar family protein n=1 Tax=Psychrobacter sp. M13 TaxID=3067275 RepID=UPI001919BC25|nr:barstar family protein [Psychrobacter sp. M13]WLP94895.1 barstar family protein [Psychrobacter sp. M13]